MVDKISNEQIKFIKDKCGGLTISHVISGKHKDKFKTYQFKGSFGIYDNKCNYIFSWENEENSIVPKCLTKLSAYAINQLFLILSDKECEIIKSADPIPSTLEIYLKPIKKLLTT